MGNTFFFQWEVALMEFLQAHMGSFGVAIASVFSTMGEELVMIAVLGFLYWSYDKEWGKYVGINIVAATVFNPMIKNVFLRRRPYFDNPGIKCLKPVDAEFDIYDINAQGYSFPSGHSTNSAAAYGSLARYRKNKVLSIVMTAIILLIGISRFCVGVHYPTDVLCGWALGLIIMLVFPWLRKKINKDWLFYIIAAVLGLPGFFYCTSNDFYTSYGLMIGGFAGFMFEEKCVNFKNADGLLRGILRVVVGAGLFLGLNALLKLPFSSEFLAAPILAARLVRTIRYAVVVFIVIGVYPMVFKCFAKGKK